MKPTINPLFNIILEVLGKAKSQEAMKSMGLKDKKKKINECMNDKWESEKKKEREEGKKRTEGKVPRPHSTWISILAGVLIFLCGH